MVDFANKCIKGMGSKDWWQNYKEDMKEVDYNIMVAEFQRDQRHKFRALMDPDELSHYKSLKSDAQRDNFIETWKENHPELKDKFPQDVMDEESAAEEPATQTQ